MSLGKREKLAILRSLVFVVRADNVTAPAEVAFIERFMRDFNISQSDFMEAKQMSNEDMGRIISNFTNDEKDMVKTLWGSAANADGKMLNSEIKQIAALSQICKIEF
jgi:uncharacterized tellurite resistance protein B-like protein